MRRAGLFAAFLFLCLTAPVWASEPQTTYFGVYLKDAKLGSLTLTRRDNVERDGKAALQTESKLRLTLSLMGKSNPLAADTVAWIEPETAAPIATESRSETGGRVTTVRASYAGQTVRFRADVQGTVREGAFTLADGERFLLDATGGLPRFPVSGETKRGKVFLADTLQLVDAERTVGASEPVTLGKTACLAHKITETNPLAPATYYMSASGEVLQGTIALGLELRREPKESALAPTTNLVDLGLLVGAAPTGVPISDPRNLTEAVYGVSGATGALPPNDALQQAAPMDGGTRVSVTAGPLPERGEPLFARAGAAPARLQSALAATAYVPSDTAEFRALARAVVGSERDAARAAAKIARFVHATVKPDSSIALLRTATDINRDRRGVCRDYTTYFTAIARAAGLPTRQCVGLALVNGVFQYHAWPQVWVGTYADGADAWVALEPTWGAPFADATHIKLAEGELTDILRVAADIGRYKIRVISAK